MKKYLLSAMTLVVMVTLTPACKQQAEKTENNARQSATPGSIPSEEKIMNLHDKLMSSFNPNWESEEPAPADYPPYYGGSFIDNDGKFVVCVVGDPAPYRTQLATILGSDDFLTETCTYSYREMMEVMDRIDLFLSNASLPQDHPVIKNFAGAAADIFENRVVVNLLEVDDAVIQAFKKDISASPAVKFEKGELPVLM